MDVMRASANAKIGGHEVGADEEAHNYYAPALTRLRASPGQSDAAAPSSVLIWPVRIPHNASKAIRRLHQRSASVGQFLPGLMSPQHRSAGFRLRSAPGRCHQVAGGRARRSRSEQIADDERMNEQREHEVWVNRLIDAAKGGWI